MSNSAIRSLLSPSSIAIVGASPDAQYAGGLVDNLLEYGYSGDLYLVNPTRDEAWGRRCYDDITDVPTVVDLVVISVPRQYVPTIVCDAGDMGVDVALIITAGFGEADQEGETLRRELQECVDRFDIRICGPNCLGIANTHDEITLANTCTRKPNAGSIGLVSQSGALAFTTFFEQGADVDIDFSYIISTGNEIDLTTSDYVEYMIDDPTVDLICTYIEGIVEPERFMTVVNRATREGIPVLVTKIGRAEGIDRATISHTGSITGNDDVWSAAFKQTGAERVSSFGGLLDRARAHVLTPSKNTKRVCIASTSGGLGSLLADLAIDSRLTVPEFNPETKDALLDIEALMTFGEILNPLDIRGYGLRELDEIGEILLSDDNFDAYIFGLGVPAVGEFAEEIIRQINQFAANTSVPIFVVWTGRRTPFDESTPGKLPYELLRNEYPVYFDAAHCIDAVNSLYHFHSSRSRIQEKPDRRSLLSDTDTYNSHFGGTDNPAWNDAESLLTSYNLPVIETKLTTDPGEAIRYFENLNGPIVLKIDSPDIPHRSEVDGVRTNLSSPIAIQEAYSDILENSNRHAPNADIHGVLVQPQITSGIEVLVGVSEDKTFDKVVTVGVGGSLIEVMDEVAIRIPPLADQDAKEAIESTALSSLIDSTSNAAENKKALTQIVQKVGQLAYHEGALAELDLNPVILDGGNATIVDILVRTNTQ